jgi:hypothetical protein
VRKFLDIDLLAGLGAFVFLVLMLTAIPRLEQLVSPEVVGAFMLAALGRAYVRIHAALAGGER